MSRTSENTAFMCLKCDLEVAPLSNGSYRNHCPGCLYWYLLAMPALDRLVQTSKGFPTACPREDVNRVADLVDGSQAIRELPDLWVYDLTNYGVGESLSSDHPIRPIVERSHPGVEGFCDMEVVV